MKIVLSFIKKEPVFIIAALLACISTLIIRPGVGVKDGIDVRTLVLLFALMSVVSGLQRQYVFEKIGNGLISKISGTKTLYLILVLICFVSSMLLTNDVALITFVPFSIMILPKVGQKDKLPLIIVLQTLAANLGSVLTPLGNPQNLYLYNISGMSAAEFVLFMLPMWLVSLVLVVLPVLFGKNESILSTEGHSLPEGSKSKKTVYIILFMLSLLTVLKILDYRILLVIVLTVILIVDRKSLLKIDYILLLTFVGFFIFIYNIRQVPEIVNWISGIVTGREFVIGILSSQVISNVPAAILLSGFTDNLKTLLLAVDVGGLGTIIASMASLISYKMYSTSEGSSGSKYMLLFTIYNVIYLVIMFLFCRLVYGV